MRKIERDVLELLEGTQRTQLSLNVAFIAERFKLNVEQTDNLINGLLNQGFIEAAKGLGSHYEYQACQITDAGLSSLQEE